MTEKYRASILLPLALAVSADEISITLFQTMYYLSITENRKKSQPLICRNQNIILKQSVFWRGAIKGKYF